MSTSLPVVPSIPQLHLGKMSLPSCSASSYAAACFALSCVTVRMTLTPQFWAKVLGMTSMASPTARKGPCWTPSSFSPALRRPVDTAISVAPPPGKRRVSKTTFRTTCMASVKLRSISFRTSLLPPRRMTVQAFGSLHSSKKAKYSSPILRISNRPQPVPMSDSRISSVRLTMVAPVARATRLLSVFRRRRNAVMSAFAK
mmetsp:Transcript_35343/g.84434  ORF Transcript_35343/g.84434 Transcript_35343/m.84434 type:complete len:200 (+) Transcript_35343:136-735(+)